MARICQLCVKGANRIKSRSKSNVATVKHQQVNLQKKTVLGMRLRICTGCIKTMKRTQA